MQQRLEPIVSRLRVIGTHIMLPAALFWIGSAFVFDSTFLVHWMAAYRPTTSQSTLELNVSRQALALDARMRETSGPPIVAIIGSSSVINGVDADEINAIWRQNGRSIEAVNFGQTGLVAYELALLKRLTLDRKIVAAVFLYNSFSFTDRLLATVVGARWNTKEMLSLRPPDLTNAEDYRKYSTGFLNEWLAVVRHGNVAKSIVLRALREELVPIPYFHDYPLESVYGDRRERVPQQAAPDTDWLRKAYLDSERQIDTVGYRGLARYLQLALDQRIAVVIAPVPEPEFSLFNKWRVGTNPAAVDSNVAIVAARYHASVWPRSRIAFLEADDTLYLDQTHFNRFGRQRYSQLLAAWLSDALQ